MRAMNMAYEEKTKKGPNHSLGMGMKAEIKALPKSFSFRQFSKSFFSK